MASPTFDAISVLSRIDTVDLSVTGTLFFTGSLGIASLTLTGTPGLTLTAPAARIVGGATSLSLRDSTNAFDNVLVLDNGNTTVRGTLTATGGFVLGAISVTQLTITTAASRIIPGVTSISHRNNANTLDNVLVLDNGNTTIRGTVTSQVNGPTYFGTNNLAATVPLIGTDAGGANIVIGNDAGLGTIKLYAGVTNSVLVTTSGLTALQLTLTTAISKILPGVTSLSLRNNADNADNLILTDAGAATFRSTVGGITTLTAGQLTISTAVGKIVPGATSLSLRNNADNADNMLITDAGLVTLRNNILLPNAVAYQSKTSGGNVVPLIMMTGGDVLQVGNSASLGNTNIYFGSSLAIEIKSPGGRLYGRWGFGQDPDGTAAFAVTGNLLNNSDRGTKFANQTSAAGAQVGTLTNAPTAGNPGYWLKVSIGGTSYAIPAWLG